MSKAKLKKYLQTLSKEQVIEVMLELYGKMQKDHPTGVLPYSWLFRKALIRQVSESHFRFPKTENRTNLCRRPDVVLHRTGMRIYCDFWRYVGAILHYFGK